jgi:hypothetical protein
VRLYYLNRTEATSDPEKFPGIAAFLGMTSQMPRPSAHSTTYPQSYSAIIVDKFPGACRSLESQH